MIIVPQMHGVREMVHVVRDQNAMHDRRATNNLHKEHLARIVDGYSKYHASVSFDICSSCTRRAVYRHIKYVGLNARSPDTLCIAILESIRPTRHCTDDIETSTFLE